MLKPKPDKRKHPRVQVQFRTHFSGQGKMFAGEGDLQDVSIGGCRIKSAVPVPAGAKLELCIYNANEDTPIVIDEAVVRWAQVGQFGLEFTQMRKDGQRRLTELCRRIAPIG